MDKLNIQELTTNYINIKIGHEFMFQECRDMTIIMRHIEVNNGKLEKCIKADFWEDCDKCLDRKLQNCQPKCFEELCGFHYGSQNEDSMCFADRVFGSTTL